MTSLRQLAATGGIEVGTRARVTRTFTEEDIAWFGQITRDDNPVHYDARWVKKKGYRAPICHGLLVGSMLCEPGGQWGWLATEMSFRFRRPVYVGDTITCEVVVTELGDRGRARGSCELTNQHGELVLTAELAGYLPSPEEQQLLRQMIDENDPANSASRG